MKIRLQRKAAFTLLEIMIALFLLTLVVAAVYSSWMAVVKGAKIGLQAAAEVQRSRVAIRTLEEALTSVRMFTADVEYYSFEAENGNKASLSFVSYLPKSFPRSGKFGDFDVRRVTFELEPSNEGGSQFVLRQNPMLMDLDIDEQEHPVVLARNVKAFEMEFWDVRAGEWIDEWTQTNQLPALVKISLQFSRRGDSFSHDEVTRVIAIPTVAVPASFQGPNAARQGGGPNVVQPVRNIGGQGQP